MKYKGGVAKRGTTGVMERFELGKTSDAMPWPTAENYENFVEERKRKGMDHFIVIAYI